MPEQPPSDNLFRFVSVRPVQDRPPEQRRTQFLEAEELASQLVRSLDAADSLAARQTVAAAYVRSDDYVAGFVHREPWVGSLREVLAALEEVGGDGGVEAAQQRIQAIVSAEPALANVQGRANLWRRVWESLWAAYLSPRTDPRDRAELIALLQALHAVEHPDSLPAVRDVARLLHAQPLVPARWFQAGAATPGPGGDDDVTPTPGTIPPGTTPPATLARLEQANALRRRYFDLEEAIADLRLTERRAQANTRPPGGPPAVSRPSGQAPSPAAEGAPVPTAVVSIGEPRSVKWSLPAEAIAALQPRTRDLVSEAGRDLALDSTAEVLARLEAEQRLAVDRLYRVAGARALVDLDLELKDQLDLDDILVPADIPTVESGAFEEPYDGSVGTVQPIGIGDLLVVKETLLGYELGQVAHVENVMQTEHRERVHRQLDRLQTTYTTATETVESNERDLQTTERFELQNQVAQTIESDTSVSLGVDTSASYGPVKVAASAEFATSTSTSDSQSSSTNYARDVTDRSVSSLTRTIQERIVTTTLAETEETNTHGFDNSEGRDHVVGVYRWLDQRYQAQVLNYGKRLMMEFIVPSPADFYHQANAATTAEGVLLEPPEPLPEGFSFRDVKPSTYQLWTDLYQVGDVDPPPPMFTTIGKSIDQVEMAHGVKLSEDYILTTKADAMPAVAGYRAIEAWVTSKATVPSDDFSWSHRVVVGRHGFELDLGDTYEAMENEDGDLPIAIKAFNVYAYALTVEVRYERTDATLEAWQLATYQSVVTAYNNLKGAYDAQVAAAAVQQSSAVAGRNPDANRQIERDELKKACIVLLTDQHFADAGAVRHTGTPFGYPEIRVREAMDEGSYIQFVEQCMEWSQLTFLLYPYFWGRKEDWLARSLQDDVDPLFAAFLKAGAARVLVPVRRLYEPALLYFLETAETWNGGAAPTISKPYYVSIVDELAGAQDVALEEAEPYGEEWEYTLPTTLVMLQEDATLPVFVPRAADRGRREEATMAALQPDEVRFLSFEGGGRAGLVIHPGMAQALEELEVLRYDHGRQVGVEGFSGSSSGSMVATLMSCGYRYYELFELLSEGAFDLVFRLEEFQLGQFSKLNGACSPPRPEPPPTVILHSEAFADPVGALLHILMRTSSFYQAPLLQAGALAMVWKDEVSLRIARLSAGEDQPGWLRQAAGIAKDELERSLRSMQVPWGKTHILEWIERTYPHVVFKLFEHMLRDTAASDPNNLFHVFKRDFAFFAGCAWRDYIDHMVSFARFRARFAAMLPDLRVPTEADFNAAGSLQQVFFDRIKAAEATAVLEAQESPGFRGRVRAPAQHHLRAAPRRPLPRPRRRRPAPAGDVGGQPELAGEPPVQRRRHPVAVRGRRRPHRDLAAAAVQAGRVGAEGPPLQLPEDHRPPRHEPLPGGLLDGRRPLLELALRRVPGLRGAWQHDPRRRHRHPDADGDRRHHRFPHLDGQRRRRAQHLGHPFRPHPLRGGRQPRDQGVRPAYDGLRDHIRPPLRPLGGPRLLRQPRPGPASTAAPLAPEEQGVAQRPGPAVVRLDLVDPWRRGGWAPTA